MITVAILINGNPIIARSACNLGKKNKKGETKYKTDCGKTIWHKRSDGAVDLAKQILNAIKEVK